jgi:hypothetical protein
MSQSDLSGRENPFVSPGTSASVSLDEDGFRDQSTGMVWFGVFEIAVGVLAAFYALFYIASAHYPNANILSIVRSVVTYGTVSIAFGWVGFGSIQCQRWARAMSFALAWMFLFSGVGLGIAPIMTLIRLLGVGTGDYWAIAVLAVAMLACGCMATSTLMIAFFGRRDVLATCEARHAEPSWSDRCPAPVLVVCACLAFDAIRDVAMLLTGSVVPFFATALEGFSSSIEITFWASVCVFVSIVTFRLRPYAYWLNLFMALFALADAVVFFCTPNALLDYYRKSGCSENQILAIQKTASFYFQPYTVIGPGLLFLFYLLSIKRYFKSRTKIEPEESLDVMQFAEKLR